jgi:hypothetical protein
MPNILTTSKLNSCFDAFAAAIHGKTPYALADSFDAATEACYEYTKGTKEFEAFSNAALESGSRTPNDSTSTASPMLIPGEPMRLVKNSQYYLIDNFVDETNRSSSYHLRFENVEGELEDFHLTRNSSITGANRPDAKRGDTTKMKGRIFFKIAPASVRVGGTSTDKYVINVVNKNHIRGGESSGDQYSDYRLACFLNESVIYVYSLMYMIRDI